MDPLNSFLQFIKIKDYPSALFQYSELQRWVLDVLIKTSHDEDIIHQITNLIDVETSAHGIILSSLTYLTRPREVKLVKVKDLTTVFETLKCIEDVSELITTSESIFIPPNFNKFLNKTIILAIQDIQNENNWGNVFEKVLTEYRKINNSGFTENGLWFKEIQLIIYLYRALNNAYEVKQTKNEALESNLQQCSDQVRKHQHQLEQFQTQYWQLQQQYWQQQKLHQQRGSEYEETMSITEELSENGQKKENQNLRRDLHQKTEENNYQDGEKRSLENQLIILNRKAEKHETENMHLKNELHRCKTSMKNDSESYGLEISTMKDELDRYEQIGRAHV